MTEIAYSRVTCDAALDAADGEPFERMRKRRGAKMPVSCHGRAIRSCRKTWASRRTSKRVSRLAGGSHRRRRHS